MSAFIILIISSLANLLLGLLVYVKNPGRPVNRVFASLTFSLVGLAAASYGSLHSSSPLVFVRLTMLFAVLLVGLFRWLSMWFPRSASHMTKARWYEVLAAAIVAVIMFMPITFSGVNVASNGNVQPLFGPGIAAFVLYFAYMVGGGVTMLLKKLHHAAGVERPQLLYVVCGTVFLFAAEFTSSLIVPLIFKISGGVALSSLYFVIFAAIIATAIIRRHLFDIRAVVARSLAYVLLLGALVGLYAVVLFAVSTIFLSGEAVSRRYEIVNVALAVLLAFTSPYLKHFFDHLTQRIFYREAYDPQAFFDQLNKVLVRAADLDELLSQAAAVVHDNFRASFCLLGVKDQSAAGYRTCLQGTAGSSFLPQEIASLRQVPPLRQQRVIAADYLPDEHEALRTSLIDHNVAVLVWLSADYRQKKDDPGYLVLGPKKSGNPYNKQDLRLLDTIADELVIAVQNALHFDETQRFNLTLRQRIDEATHNLQRANRRLKELDQAKDDFITMASHQLRTPLTAVRGYVSMVLDEDAGKVTPTQIKLLRQAEFSTKRMTSLVSDLLNVSRLNSGKFMVNPKPANLAEIVAGEVDQLQTLARSHDVALTFHKPRAFSVVLIDIDKTSQVIMNFIDNAIHYTPRGGQIAVTVRDEPAFVECVVADSGIGIPPAARKELFTKFFRADNAKKMRPDGTGIGLYLAKAVIEAQHGEIILITAENKGSTFGFRIPKQSAPTPTRNTN